MTTRHSRTRSRIGCDCKRRGPRFWRWSDPIPAAICAATPRARPDRLHARDAIRVGLHSPDNGWLSVLAGWRHGERAFIATQMNHGGLPQLSLSMVLRASLIQSLIARGVREIVSLDGCAGALQLSCVEEPIDRAQIDVRTPLADWSRGALRMLWPRLAHRIFRDEPAPLPWRPRSRSA